jgi:hypothetical protein
MHIHIGPRAQLIAVLGLLGAIGAAIAAQLPEIQRYLKVKSM